MSPVCEHFFLPNCLALTSSKITVIRVDYFPSRKWLAMHSIISPHTTMLLLRYNNIMHADIKLSTPPAYRRTNNNDDDNNNILLSIKLYPFLPSSNDMPKSGKQKWT
jgi:hypothetical protein